MRDQSRPLPIVAIASILVLSLAVLVGAPALSSAQQERIELARPIPGPVVPPRYYRDALALGTRSADGSPGPNYWQTRAEYDIDAKLDPRSGLLSGHETISFENTSPVEIPELMVHLHQNLHAQGVTRNRATEVTGGITLYRLAVDGAELFETPSREDAGYVVNGQIARIRLPEPLPAGGQLSLEVTWSFVVPQNGVGRMGQSDREIYYIGYWFPKIAVYDDLHGWDAEPYLGGSEFYDSFADYRLALTVPAGWTVMATGQLQNAEEVLSAATRERLAQAATSDAVVRIASPQDRQDGAVTSYPASGALTYRFVASQVRDVTWTTSDTQSWDATSALVPDRDGDGSPDRVMIHSFWREDRAPLWSEQARYAKHSIEFLSRESGLAYPWPHMTSVEGDEIIGGGMEFPMLTLIGTYRDREARNLYSVTVHELAHMWTPLIVGSNEKRHAWMDEGFASYLANRGLMEYFPDGDDPETDSRNGYVETAQEETEGAMMRHGDYYEVGYGTASYAKPATLLVTLRNLLGEEVFGGGVHTYFQEWAFRHPTPWDFFSTLERAAGVDLDWFWSSWYYETWVLDQAVGEVANGPGGAVVTIEDHGYVPMPCTVRITATGGVIDRSIPVSHWLSGATSFRIELPESAGEVTGVQIDPGALLPDAHPENNVWPPKPESESGSS